MSVYRLWAWLWDFLHFSVGRLGAEVRCCFRPLYAEHNSEKPLVRDEEPLAHQPRLCYANSSALYAENDLFLPFLNKIDFILSFYCRLSCLQKAVIWRCLMVRACLCVPKERRGCLTSEFLSCVKRIAFFGAEFNEMINDPQDSHSQQGEKKKWGSWRLNRFYCDCMSAVVPLWKCGLFLKHEILLFDCRGLGFLWCSWGRQKQV